MHGRGELWVGVCGGGEFADPTGGEYGVGESYGGGSVEGELDLGARWGDAGEVGDLSGDLVWWLNEEIGAEIRFQGLHRAGSATPFFPLRDMLSYHISLGLNVRLWCRSELEWMVLYEPTLTCVQEIRLQDDHSWA